MVKPDMIAAGNIGCMVQIAGGTSVSCGSHDLSFSIGRQAVPGQD